VNEQQAEEDAQALHKAGEAKWGTDEDKFIEILTKRSRPHLLKVLGIQTPLSFHPYLSYI